MRFGELKSIGHNIADSVASDIGLMIGVYQMDVFGEAAASEGGVIGVDFLTGRVTAGEPSDALREAVRLYAEALPDLCARHGTSRDAFARLSARFGWTAAKERWFEVEVKDRDGRRSIDTYVGSPGRRPRTVDETGRVRRHPGVRSDTATA